MTRDDVVRKRVAEAGPLYKTIMLKAYQGKESPRQAIKAMCLHCTGYDRETIATCSGYSCPLWAWRPYTPTSEAGNESGNDASAGDGTA